MMTGWHAACLGLQSLCPTNFTPIMGDGGIVAHVLGFERANL